MQLMRNALIGFAFLALGGAVRAQDYSSGGYCNPVCLQHGFASAPECSYHNYAQCEATRSGLGGICIDNPFLSMCSRKTVGQQAARKSKRPR
jgi:hypothetical protein